MTNDEVLDEARADGFELIERMGAGRWAVGWARGVDDRWPCFLEERQALNWVRGRLSRGRMFAKKTVSQRGGSRTHGLLGRATDRHL
jgi:hypothetical protein